MKLKSLLALGALAAGAVYLYKKHQEESRVVTLQQEDGPTAVHTGQEPSNSVEQDFAEEEAFEVSPKTVVIATNNKSKVEELRRMLEPLGFQVRSLKEIGLSIEVEETGSTFEENALLKAQAVYDRVKCPVIADDSGICVDALGGAPGVYSARYSGEGPDGEGATDEKNNQKLLAAMEGVTDRSAQFVCVIAYLDVDGQPHTFRGVCHGQIGFEERGDRGFGYDPLFMVGDRSTAELSPEEKDAISHRGAAIRGLVAWLAAQQD